MIVIGVDEAGRGPLLGPVYAGAAICNEETECIFTDSKKMSKKKRKLAYKHIIENIKYGVGSASEKEIDDINILNATALAMKRAINDLVTKHNIKEYKLLIDGVRWEKYFNNCTSIIKGDEKVKSISAASIIAKECHDDYIKNLCNENPELDEYYGLMSNMGYGTKKHMEGINKYGPSKFHRLTFKNVK